MQKYLKKVNDGKQGWDGRRIPPKWRLSVSARPDYWNAMNSARCHEYRALARFGEAAVRYFLGDEQSARDSLELLEEIVLIRRKHRDECELPLFKGLTNE